MSRQRTLIIYVEGGEIVDAALEGPEDIELIVVDNDKEQRGAKDWARWQGTMPLPQSALEEATAAANEFEENGINVCARCAEIIYHEPYYDAEKRAYCTIQCRRISKEEDING